MARAIKALFHVGPILFGLGFVAPLTAQTLAALAIDAPFGLPHLTFGILVGLGLGLIAQIRGRWI
ncbi:MAG: hypothetical protein AAF253_07430 [Pseudomonadota bacterium]